MKNLLKMTLASALLIFVSGCSEDLLDNSGESNESQPTELLTSAQTAEGSLTNPAIAASFITGVYAQMVQTQTGGSTGHDDFGQKAYDIFGDMASGDMALSVSTYGWYRASITELQAMEDFTFFDNQQIWSYYYTIIRSANSVIENLGGNDFVPELDDNKFALGQAKAMRAHSYFYLTQYFQREYNGSEEILPLYLDAIAVNLPKSTAAEVYDQMEADLTSAISLMEGFNRTDKSQVNQDVARGMLAYVLGAKGGRDADVAALTQAVIDNGNHTVMSPSEVTGGFTDYNSNSWMWGIDITETIGLGLVSWWGQVDAFSYSYAWAGDYKVIDSDLYDAIPEDDVRKGQFFNNPESGRHLQPLFKFYASDQIGGVSQTVSADYVYMRIEEMYLLNAEANARLGNRTEAITSLKAVVSNRMPDVSFIDGLSDSDDDEDENSLIGQTYLQTRIELWGEGKSYLALKRNKATIVRGPNHLSLVGVPIPYNDERLQFEIPQQEIQNNPFVSSQNN